MPDPNDVQNTDQTSLSLQDAGDTPPPAPPTWTDDTPLDQIPAEHRVRVFDEREAKAKAATESKAAIESAAAAARAEMEKAAGSGPKTRARVSAAPKAGKPARIGARPRRKSDVVTDAPAPDQDRVAVVLQTSRLTGRHGRAVPRRTTALVTVERALGLIVQNAAREATEAEGAAALLAEPRVYID